jgi:EmrB/QacA subfamily drug resistance transporter
MQFAGSHEQTPGYERRWIGLAFIGISLIVISLDNTILNVAIPSISRTLNASLSELQWIVDGYVLVFAALLLTMGGLGDRFGRKKALLAGLFLFGVGSFAAATAQTTGALIASRAFLGVGGSLIMPATLSIISATFPQQERSRAIALWAAVFGLGVGLGPVIGGFLLEHFEWNSVFFVNLPVITIAIIGCALTLGDSRDEHAPKADIPGVILSITGLFALLYGIINAGQEGWTHTNVLVAFALAIVLLGAFAWWENRNPNAMLPMRFFRNMSFTGANLALALLTFSLFGSLFFVSQYLQTVQGYNTLDAGLRVLPMAIALSVAASRSAIVAARIGTKYTVALGIGIAAAGLFFMATTYHIDTPYIIIAIGQVILATGMGIAVSPATNSVMQSVPVSKAGIGSAMNDTTRQLGGALGVALLGTVMNNAYLSGINALHSSLPIPAALSAQADKLFEAISSGIQAAHAVANQIGSNPLAPAGLAKTIIDAADKAFVTGMNNAMFVGAIIMVASAVYALIFLPAQVRRMEDDSVPAALDGVQVAASGD